MWFAGCGWDSTSPRPGMRGASLGVCRVGGISGVDRLRMTTQDFAVPSGDRDGDHRPPPREDWRRQPPVGQESAFSALGRRRRNNAHCHGRACSHPSIGRILSRAGRFRVRECASPEAPVPLAVPPTLIFSRQNRKLLPARYFWSLEVATRAVGDPSGESGYKRSIKIVVSFDYF